MFVPYETDNSLIMCYRPYGLFISNGPGSPEDVKPAIELIRSMKGTLPIFGVGMGSQLIALAYGAKTVKMKHGHYGGNHPIQSLSDGKVGVAAQNHSYAIVRDSLTGTGLEVSHINLTVDVRYIIRSVEHMQSAGRNYGAEKEIGSLINSKFV